MNLPEELTPRMRGITHAWAMWFALVACVVLALYAPTGLSRAAALVYGIGLCALFAASGLYHRWRWNPRWRPLLRRIDHSMIFIFIAASFTPVSLLVLDGAVQVIVLVSVWVGALAGVALSVAWTTAPRALVAACYLALGWVSVLAVPQLATKLGVAPFVLFVTGGLLYTVGAVIYATRRPNPWPRTFGFHEIFHVLVIAAATAHFVAMAGWVIPAG
jgi:hemolysin III